MVCLVLVNVRVRPVTSLTDEKFRPPGQGVTLIFLFYLIFGNQ